jgi:hypothetical protein
VGGRRPAGVVDSFAGFGLVTVAASGAGLRRLSFRPFRGFLTACY